MKKIIVFKSISFSNPCWMILDDIPSVIMICLRDSHGLSWIVFVIQSKSDSNMVKVLFVFKAIIITEQKFHKVWQPQKQHPTLNFEENSFQRNSFLKLGSSQNHQRRSVINKSKDPILSELNGNSLSEMNFFHRFFRSFIACTVFKNFEKQVLIKLF